MSIILATLDEAVLVAHSRTQRTYLVMRAMSTEDGTEGFDVFVIEVTLDTLATWEESFALADKLKAEKHVERIVIKDSIGEWRAADVDGEPIHDDEIYEPLWDTEPSRTESEYVEFSPEHIEWVAMVRNSDTHVNAYLWRSDLPEIAKALKERG